MSTTAVFVHGGWITPSSWHPFVSAPLLLVAGSADQAMPPGVARRTLRAYRASPARTELQTFPGRTNWIIAQPGWEEVAQGCIDWTEDIQAASSRQ